MKKGTHKIWQVGLVQDHVFMKTATLWCQSVGLGGLTSFSNVRAFCHDLKSLQFLPPH